MDIVSIDKNRDIAVGDKNWDIMGDSDNNGDIIAVGNNNGDIIAVGNNDEDIVAMGDNNGDIVAMGDNNGDIVTMGDNNGDIAICDKDGNITASAHCDKDEDIAVSDTDRAPTTSSWQVMEQSWNPCCLSTAMIERGQTPGSQS
jgi:hypothetical protein